MIRDIDTGEWIPDPRTIAEVAYDNLYGAKSFLIWKTQPYYSQEDFFERIRNTNAEYTTGWLLRFGCSWCGMRATHNLGTSDMCCEAHWNKWFKNLALNPDDF